MGNDVSIQDHIYVWPDTTDLVPSVTTVLKVIDKPDLDRWRVIQGIMLARENKQADFEEILTNLDQARDYRGMIGTGVHECIGAWHKHEPMPDAYSFPEVKQLTDNYTAWALESLDGDPKYVETAGFASIDGLRYGGRPDAGIVTLKPGTFVSIDGVGQKLRGPVTTALLDFKTGKTSQPEWGLQLSAYRRILTETFRVNPGLLVTVRIEPNGVHAKVWDNTIEMFNAALVLWYWKFGTKWLEDTMRKGE